ncbi:aldolase [Microbacterium esteraromaticum]|uniref:Aldolase n=1 Tax=Microbacterium esteraromaticum TaxID=57043 RepID=A0A7D8ALL7_9MICO|nr:aldolase [Microbacterium esteraromaticum]
MREDDFADIDASLAQTDALLSGSYPGDDGSRQPVHTLYVPADRFDPALPARFGADALAAVEAAGGMTALAESVGLGHLAGELAPLVDAKLRREPIEDLRLDFEDGYGTRGDDEEDAAAVLAAERVAEAVAAGTATPFIGIRFKCFEAPTRRRGIRTLDRFVTTLAGAGELPEGLILTLPKVTTVAQVEAMVALCERFEERLGLAPGRLRFEVQMETPQLIVAADGTAPVATLLHRAQGRVSALHYGTYDYSASLQIAAAYQSMEHPAADYAKQVMQVAVAETGVRLSDGSTNVIPLGEKAQEAWTLHARLVRRSLERGYYQGWDLHANQLPTRYLATYAFYREGFDAAARRLDNYLHGSDATIMDEPATARALARFVVRGLECGALTDDEVRSSTGASPAELTRLAHPKLATKEA